MLKLTFYPESDKPEFIQSARQYQAIWDQEKEHIVKVTEQLSGLEFREKFINVVVFEGISASHPLRLRASNPNDVKKATIVHELGHRLLTGNKIRVTLDHADKSLESHKQLNLILYDIWISLYGKQFTQAAVTWESKLAPAYQEAWNWALSLSKQSRAAEFSKLVSDARNLTKVNLGAPH